MSLLSLFSPCNILKFIKVVYGAIVHLFLLACNISFFLSVPQIIHLFCLYTIGLTFSFCSYEECEHFHTMSHGTNSKEFLQDSLTLRQHVISHVNTRVFIATS